MAVTTAPAVEAMTFLRDRINDGYAYDLPIRAEYAEQIIDPLEEITGTRVDIVSEMEETMNDTLDVENRTSHVVRIWIRAKVESVANDAIDPLKLLVRAIFQRVNNADSSDGRVQVWECDLEGGQNPDKDILQQSWLFVSSIILRLEVVASA